MKSRLSAAAVCLCLLGSALPAVAHHSFDAEYDGNKPIVLTGIVTKVEWMNPHARFYVDVKGNDGSVTSWNMELGSPAILIRRGWTINTIKVGDQITVNASLDKEWTKKANARSVTLADGTSVFGASSADKE